MIGLLTPFRVANYGTKLQAYAVQECIRSLGHDTQIIDFGYAPVKKNPFNILERVIFKVVSRKYMDSKRYAAAPKDIENLRKKRIDCINSFDSHYDISKKVMGQQNMRELGTSYSAVLCGSDQIWNPINVGSEIFLLEWVPAGTKKISFAASFGISELPMLLKPKYKRELEKFHAISVREDSAKKMIADLGLNAEWILDPTLIVDKEVWENLAAESSYSILDDYIFCYFLGDGAGSRETVKEMKEQNPNLKIISLSHFKGYNECDNHFADLDLYDVRVTDFVRLIKNAKYVCTDSFHATAFSVIFEKEFVVCNRHGNGVASTNSRIHSFLHSIGAEKRICSSPDEVETILKEKVEYEGVNRRLNEKRKESIIFIKKSLS